MFFPTLETVSLASAVTQAAFEPLLTVIIIFYTLILHKKARKRRNNMIQECIGRDETLQKMK